MNSLTLKLALIFLFCAAVVTACSSGDDDDSGSVNNDIVATETWDSDLSNGDGYGTWTFKKRTDGSIFVDGEWVYEGNSAPETVTCPFTNAPVILDGNKMSFTANGTAYLKDREGPGSTSGFVLKVAADGIGGASTSHFSYEIEFDSPYWQPNRVSGEGEASLTGESEIFNSSEYSKKEFLTLNY